MIFIFGKIQKFQGAKSGIEIVDKIFYQKSRYKNAMLTYYTSLLTGTSLPTEYSHGSIWEYVHLKKS